MGCEQQAAHSKALAAVLVEGAGGVGKGGNHRSVWMRPVLGGVEVTGMGGDGRQEQSVISSPSVRMNYGGIYWEEEAEADL